LPRPVWTHRFVERRQGMIWDEHWRVAFRRPYFTSRRAMPRNLDACMPCSNEQRPHPGHRLRGRTPAALCTGVAGRAR